MWVAAAAAAAMADGSGGESPPLHRHDRGVGGDRAKCCTMGDAGRPARAVGRPGAATEKQSTFCRCGGGGESRGEQEEGEEARTSSAMRALPARTPGGRGSVQKSPFVGAPVRQSGPQAICTPRTAFATSPPTQILCATEEEKTIRALFVASVQSPDLSCTASTSGPTGSCVGLQLYSCTAVGRPAPAHQPPRGANASSLLTTSVQSHISLQYQLVRAADPDASRPPPPTATFRRRGPHPCVAAAGIRKRASAPALRCAPQGCLPVMK